MAADVPMDKVADKTKVDRASGVLYPTRHLFHYSLAVIVALFWQASIAVVECKMLSSLIAWLGFKCFRGIVTIAVIDWHAVKGLVEYGRVGKESEAICQYYDIPTRNR